MATDTQDLQRLIVQLEATFTQYNRQWQRAMGTTDTNVKRVQTRFDGMARTINRAGSNTANAMRPLNLQTANMASQFQDIAVQLQSGQSPFIIALQQGTQLSAVLNQTRNPIRALGTAFLSVINPVSLVTLAVIGLGGAAVQWLTRTEDGVDGANDAIEEHIKRIKEIARGYEDAQQAAQDYIEENRRLPEAAVASDIGAEQQRAIQQFENALVRLGERQEVVRTDLENLRLAPQLFGDLIALNEQLVSTSLNTNSTQQEFDAFIVTLTNLRNTTAEDRVRRLANEMLALINEALEARLQVESLGVALDNLPSNVTVNLRVQSEGFREAFDALRDLAPELRSAGDVARAEAQEQFDRAASLATTYGQLVGLAEQYEQTVAAINEQERRQEEEKSSRGRSSSIKAAERERDAVTELIAQLEHEYELLGLTEQEKQVANALRRAGAAATAEERDRIIELVNATYLEGEALEQTKQAMRDFQSIAKSALQGFISDLQQGKSATEALGNALNNIGNQLISKGLDLLFGAIFPFAEGGIAAHGRPVPLRKFARGGVSRTAAIFGEAGPEAAVPLPDGRRIPVELRMPEMPRMGGAGGALTVHVVSDDEKFSAFVTDKAGQVVAQSAPTIVGAAVGQANKSAPAALAKHQQQRAGSDYRTM